MRQLTERERIESLCMRDFADRSRTQTEVVKLFNVTHPDRQPPIGQSMSSRIEKNYRQFEHVRDIKKSGRPSIKNEDKLNILITVEENPHSTLKATASTFNLAPSTVHKVWKQANYHPYKMRLIHELSEEDFDR